MGRAGSKYGVEQWQAAEQCVISERLTLEDAALRTGIPLGTLKRRSSLESWCQIRDGMLEYRPLVQRLKIAALKRAVDDPTPDTIGAWALVERTHPERTYTGLVPPSREQVIDIFGAFARWTAQRAVEPAWFETLKRTLVQYLATLEV